MSENNKLNIIMAYFKVLFQHFLDKLNNGMKTSCQDNQSIEKILNMDPTQ